MWTRKVAAPVVAVAMGALFIGGASPAAASGPMVREAASEELSFRAARKLARRLEAKQREERSLVFTDLGRGVRRSSTRIDFSYRDRSTSDVLCKARIVVVQAGAKRTADIRKVRCHGIPSEFLAFEDASADLGHDLRGELGADVIDSLDRYRESLGKCDEIVVPRERRNDVDTLVGAGFTFAYYMPMRDRLGEFDIELREIRPGDPVLARGVLAWDRTLALVDSLPAAAADPCEAVREWAANGFTDETAPADFDQITIIHQELRRERRKLQQTVDRLLEAGIRKRPAWAFTAQVIGVVATPG